MANDEHFDQFDNEEFFPREILSPEVLNLNGEDLKESYNVFVDLRFGGGFNWLFDNKADHRLLIGMLNTFLPANVPPIKSLTNTLQPLLEGEDPMSYVFNLCYYDDLDRLILIDVQKTSFKNYQLWTAARLAKAATIGTQNMESPSKHLIGVGSPVIGLSIIDFAEIDDPYDNSINLVSNSEQQQLPADLTKPILLLANLHNMQNIKDSEIAEAAGTLSNDKDKYLFILKFMGRMGEVPDELDTEQFAPLFEKACLVEMNEQELKDYYSKVTDQMVFEEALTKRRNEFFVEEFRQYFKQELETMEDKRKHQEETTIHLYKTTALELKDIAEVIGLPLNEVTTILNNYGGHYSF